MYAQHMAPVNIPEAMLVMTDCVTGCEVMAEILTGKYSTKKDGIGWDEGWAWRGIPP